MSRAISTEERLTALGMSSAEEWTGLSGADRAHGSVGMVGSRVRAPKASDGVAAPGVILADRYLVQRLVGSGTAGRVYRALDLALEQPVALKEFVKGAGADGFLRELGALFELRHPNILECRSVFMAGPYRYLVYEFMADGSLRERLRANAPPLELVRLLRQAAAGVAHAHARNVLHRDLKPENVLLTGGPSALTAKVADFGVSTLGTELEARSAIGSPAYMAPEQFHDVYDLRVDVYALGVMLFEALCGCRPFYGSPAQIMMQHLDKAAPIPEWLPSGLRLVLQRALTKDPDARFPTVERFVTALDGALESDAAALEGSGWPVDVGPADTLAVTRESVLVRTGRTMLRYDRRGRLVERVAGVDGLLAAHDHYVMRCGDLLVVHTPLGDRTHEGLPSDADIALSAEARVIVSSEGGAFVLDGKRRARLAETGSGVVAAGFTGPDQEPVLARSSNGRAWLELGRGRVDLPESVSAIWGHTEREEVIARSAVEPRRLMLVRDGSARIVDVASGALSCDGNCFVGASPTGELITVSVTTGRVARTRWEAPLAAAAACTDALAWVTRSGQLLCLRS